MNRREFFSFAAGATLISAVPTMRGYAGSTTPLYVKGLVMFDFGASDVLKIALPKAPGHKATLAVLPLDGSPRSVTIKGHGFIEARSGASSESPRIAVPELVRMKEFYGTSTISRVDDAPSVITIPYSAIHAVTTSEVSKARYTFLRADTNEEVHTFRPRRIAETIKIDLSSASVLRLVNGRVSIPLETTRELHMEYAPESVRNFDAYHDHFHHFFSYVERPAALDFDVVPKKLGGSSTQALNIGHHFMPVGDYLFCYAVALP